MKRKVIIVDGKRLHLVFGHLMKDWVSVYSLKSDELWDVKLEELLDGTLEINENIWYWLIGDRCYETDETV